MATIQVNRNDLRKMIREAVARLTESEEWYDVIPLCRLPYFVSIVFSDHAIDREYEREISEDMIVDNAKQVIKDVIEDYQRRKLTPDSYFKVIDRDTCAVAVCGISPSHNRKRINKVVVVTCYIWDGRFNIDNGNNYYINEPGIDYLEAKKWNEENQDKVISYTEWKRGSDVEKQKKKAEWEYGKRNPYYETDHETLMKRMNMTYDNRDKAYYQSIRDSLPHGDLQAIKDYFRDMDTKKIDMEPLEEMVRKAVKQALREHNYPKTNTNTSRKKTR